MYNPYLSQNWDDRMGRSRPEAKTPPAKEKTGLGGLLKSLKLEDLDTGDVLLMLLL